MDEPEVNGQVVPAILRKHFPNDTEKMRALLADPSVKGDGTGGGKRKELWERGLEIASDATIKRKVEMNRLPDMAARSMHTDPHWAAASQFRTSNKDSVETPHDRRPHAPADVWPGRGAPSLVGRRVLQAAIAIFPLHKGYGKVDRSATGECRQHRA